MVALEPSAGKDTMVVSSALTANHFGHRVADDVVVDLFWSRSDGDEFRVEVADRREDVRFVLRPTTGKEAIRPSTTHSRSREARSTTKQRPRDERSENRTCAGTTYCV